MRRHNIRSLGELFEEAKEDDKVDRSGLKLSNSIWRLLWAASGPPLFCWSRLRLRPQQLPKSSVRLPRRSRGDRFVLAFAG